MLFRQEFEQSTSHKRKDSINCQRQNKTLLRLKKSKTAIIFLLWKKLIKINKKPIT